MTELQNNDLALKLWATSPVEPTQTNQINLSDSIEKVPSTQAPLGEAQASASTIPQESIWATASLPTESAATNLNSPADKPLADSIHTENVANNNVTNNIPNNNVSATAPVAPVKVGNVMPNNVVAPSANTWVMGNSVNKVVNSNNLQKTSDIDKKGSKTEFWKWLASGVLASIWLLVIGITLFDNWSLLTSITNGLKLTNDDSANEVVKMEDALAFGDSVSNSYVDNVIGGSEDEANDSKDVWNWDEELIDSDDSKENNSDLEETLVADDEKLNDESDEELEDENKKDLIVDETDDDTKVVVKNDLDDTSDDEDNSTDDGQKSSDNTSKNKMAGSIVSIFDDEEDLESDEIGDDDSSEEVPSISYKHVNKVEDANWVMSANCDSLHCGDISEADPEELVLCTEFRQSDKLDDNANRIGSNWICRYKDASELVYLELK